MKLTRVEIQGFKSFADRTVIKFDADITSIVGPNGCGKSNIADAIRWAMGEQSTKRLRAQDMENIVFSGSDTRGPMSLAEVSLLFRNDGSLNHPIYGSCDEISVTRRYYQVGESEYLLNGVPCRRKDITELLSAAGAGSRVYSVVEQGRIGWIVISKPEEKRHLIEEAAGVAVYKSRMASIERKMEKTRANLQRISDIIREMESNLAHLKRQAQKAKRFKKYQDELMDLELHDASHRYLRMIQDKKVVDSELEEIKRKKKELEETIALTEGEMDVLEADIAQMEERMGTLQQDIYSAQNESALLAAGIERSVQDVKDLEMKAAGDLEEIEKLEDKRQRCSREIDAHLQRRRELEERIGRERENLDAVTAELESMKEQQAGLLSLHEENRQKMVELASRLASLKAKREEGDKAREETDTKLRELRSEKSSAEKKVTEMDLWIRERRREHRRHECSIEEMRAEKRRLGDLLASTKEEIAGQDRKIEVLDEEIFNVRSAVRMLEASAGEARSEEESTQAACREICSSLLSDKLQCMPGYERALRAVLDRFLGCIVVADVESALSWHLSLSKRDVRNVSFIPRVPSRKEEGKAASLLDGEEGVAALRSVVTPTWDAQELVDELLHEVFVVRDVSHAVELHRRTGGEASFVTIEGEVVTPEGALFPAGGRSAAEANKLIEEKLEERRRRLGELSEKRNELTGRHEKLRETIKSTAAHIEELGNEIHEAEKELIRKKQEVDTAAGEIGALNRRIVELNRKAEDTASRKLESDSEAQEIAGLVPSISSEIEDLETLQRETNGRIEKVRVLIEEKMTHKGAHTSSLENLEKERGELDESIDRLRQTLRELSERRDALEAGVAAGTQQQGRKIAGIFLDGERNEQLKADLAKMRNDVEELRSTLNDAKFKSREKETLVRSMRKDVDAVETESFDHQTKLLTITGEIDKISQNMKLRWRRNPEEAVYLYHCRPAPDGSAEQRIEELTKLLERMGPVNLLAIDDYEKTEEKYRFYLGERTDLEEAIEKFKVAITKMNREYKRKFVEAFEKINENFKRLFPLLFTGGHAYLELLDPTKILETGVEIKAQPPGKRLGNLDMMSGGEKALTAIALIFSIFSYRPSPFCILDEVDAPLDEANVQRFNDMLRNMTQRSQFILMTHSKLTMQCSDILYGVTMEEPGISKLLSTKIDKVREGTDRLTAVA